jgi:hypothetical protein
MPGNRGAGVPPAKIRISQRRGQSLVEFAVVALVTYLLLAAIITFGFYFYAAQGSQSAVDVLAREISRSPLPADSMTVEEVLYRDPTDPLLTPEDSATLTAFRNRVFSEDFLVFDVDQLGNQNFFLDVVPTWPIVNQQLASLMILDLPDFDGDGTPDRRLFRYPGTLLAKQGTPTGFTVGIPIVQRSRQGPESIRWVPVIEEIDSQQDPDPFRISSAQQGLVALRINYPVQSGAMSGHVVNSSDPFAPSIGNPVLADDDAVSESNPNERPGDLIAQPLIRNDGTYPATPFGGTYGLGAQGAMGQVVRPFRRVISAQAVYRREIFE